MPELEFLDATGRVPAGGDPVAARLQAAARTAVGVRLGADGGLRGYRFAGGLDGEQRNFLRGTLAVFAFTVPPGAGAGWNAAEADGSGEFTARYVRLPASADGPEVERTKVAYAKVVGQAAPPQHELRGAARASFATRHGWLAAVVLDEGMTTKLPLLDLRVRHDRRARVVLAACEQQPVEQAAAADAAWEPASGCDERLGGHAAADERRRWEHELAGADLAALLAEAARILAAAPLDRDRLNELFLRLQWLVKLDPGAAAAIGEAVGTQALGGDAAALALSALGAAGSEAAQSVLARVRRDGGLPAAVRDAASVAMLQLAQPTDEVMGALVADANGAGDDAQSALLTLGALAPRAAAAGAGATAPLEALLRMEGDAAARGELPTWLRALGNAGTDAAVEIAQRHFGNADAGVRAAACDALRRVAGEPATRVLLDAGLADPDAAVRAAAIAALAGRAAALPALRAAATDDAEAAVRARAIDAIGRSGTAADRDALARIVAGDAEPRLRELAGRWLRGA
jgi:hypothetical protein